ncbi:Acyl-protein thioesterase [Lachnellula suecica]|uniref:Acyl-protein thioesterase n=1 Tax=Lachnellula suecica TaxID=602035 RepID=A0A8T9BSW2_9HELO|nr:Acyl-protein thioesterase [Lachnellula suecica]
MSSICDSPGQRLLRSGPTTKNPSPDETPSDDTTIIAPSGGHTHTVIFLHGREDFGSDLAQYFFDSKDSEGRSLAEIFPSIRWVFPTAKLRYSAQRGFEFSNSSFAEALKGEEIISQWFDVWNIAMPEEKEDLMVPGLCDSIGDILRLIKEEAENVPLERIMLGGISQGCATAILALLSSGVELGGFIGWCSWLPFQKSIEKLPAECIDSKDEISRNIQAILQIPTVATNATPLDKASNELGVESIADSLCRTLDVLRIQSRRTAKTPMFLAHSEDDETVPVSLGEGLHQTMKHLGFDVTWEKYQDGGHWINPEKGVNDMSTFLKKVLRI